MANGGAAQVFDFPPTSGQRLRDVTASSWGDLVVAVNMAIAESGARRAVVRLPDSDMVITRAQFIAQTTILGQTGYEYLIAGTLTNVVALRGNFTVHTAMTEPPIVVDGVLNGGVFTFMGGTFKSNATSPMIEVKATTNDVVIDVQGGSTLSSGAGKVLKVTTADTVKINGYAGADIKANSIESASGQTVSFEQLDSSADFGTQANMNGSLEAGTFDVTADVIGFTPTTAGNWSGSIPTIQAALDQLASGAAGAGASAIRSITSSDSPFTADSNDTMILVDSSGGAVTVVLPAKAADRRITVKDSNGSASTNQITVQPGGGGELIDGVSNFVIDIGRAAISFVCDGSNWHAF